MKRELLKIGIISFTVLFCLAGCKEDEKPELSVSDITLTFSAEGESKSFEIKSNTAWTITKSQDASWIKSISPVSGNGNATINVAIRANTSTVDTRNDELTISAEGVMPVKVSIRQEKAPLELSVQPNILNFSAMSESKSFVITANTAWTITGHETQTWITSVSPISEEGNDIVYVTVETNPSAVVARNATLAFTVEGVTLTTMNIQQAKHPTPEITSFKPTQAIYGTSVTITGKNFNIVKDENIVKFNEFTAEIVSVTATAITAIVPKNLDCSGKISVTSRDTIVLSATDFTYLPLTTVSTLAGSGTAGFVNGTGSTARFDSPHGVAIDAFGNIYVADNGNHSIRKITPAGEVSTLAGNGTMGFVDGAVNTARFSFPRGVAVDASNNIYVADYFNHCIRKITPAGVVTTLAGNGTAGFVDGTGIAAQFNRPNSVVVDALGNVYVADQLNNSIRKITPAGVVTTLAGNGTAGFADGAGNAAQFYYPSGVEVDAFGNIYVADTGNYRIRKISPTGKVSTLAGSGIVGFADGLSNVAQFDDPSGVTVDAHGNLYVADRGNHRIRKITSAGEVSTLAGSRYPGLVDNVGIGAMGQFALPHDVVVNTSDNTVYVADGNTNRCIRKIIVE